MRKKYLKLILIFFFPEFQDIFSLFMQNSELSLLNPHSLLHPHMLKAARLYFKLFDSTLLQQLAAVIDTRHPSRGPSAVGGQVSSAARAHKKSLFFGVFFHSFNAFKRTGSWLWALHLSGLLGVDLDGVDPVFMDAGLVEVSAVAELLLLVGDLCAVWHHWWEETETRRHTFSSSGIRIVHKSIVISGYATGCRHDMLFQVSYSTQFADLYFLFQGKAQTLSAAHLAPFGCSLKQNLRLFEASKWLARDKNKVTC